MLETPYKNNPVNPIFSVIMSNIAPALLPFLGTLLQRNPTLEDIIPDNINDVLQSISDEQQAASASVPLNQIDLNNATNEQLQKFAQNAQEAEEKQVEFAKMQKDGINKLGENKVNMLTDRYYDNRNAILIINEAYRNMIVEKDFGKSPITNEENPSANIVFLAIPTYNLPVGKIESFLKEEGLEYVWSLNLCEADRKEPTLNMLIANLFRNVNTSKDENAWSLLKQFADNILENLLSTLKNTPNFKENLKAKYPTSIGNIHTEKLKKVV